jgi:hypothetical protein
VLDVNFVDASEVFWSVSEVPSVDFVVTAHDDKRTMQLPTTMSLIGIGVISNMMASLPDSV